MAQYHSQYRRQCHTAGIREDYDNLQYDYDQLQKQWDDTQKDLNLEKDRLAHLKSELQ